MKQELVNESAQEIVLDKSNKVSFPGFPYKFEALGEKILVALDQYKSGYECARCKGRGKIVNLEGDGSGLVVICPVCEGKSVKQGGIIIPEISKTLPSSGIVVSMGRKAKELCTEYDLGDRVLFSVHSGSMIPTRAGLMIKQMDWYAAWIKVDGADELGAFDFVVEPTE